MSALPTDIQEMLDVVPLEVRKEVEAEWSEEKRQDVLADVRAIIIDALETQGGTEA